MSSEHLVPVSTLPTPDDFQTERRQRRAMILHERNDGSNHDIKKKKMRQGYGWTSNNNSRILEWLYAKQFKS